MTDPEKLAKFVYNSNRLDGVHVAFETTLDLILHPPDPMEDSVDLPGLAGDKTFFRQHVLSHADAVRFLPTLAEMAPFNAEHICDLHRRMMDGVILSGGEFRECTLRYKNIPRVEPRDIAPRMKRLLAIMNVGFARARDKAILAWQIHHEFVYLHPFIEGNGRMARLLLNLTRMRAGLGLEVVPFAESRRYVASIHAYGQKLAALLTRGA